MQFQENVKQKFYIADFCFTFDDSETQSSYDKFEHALNNDISALALISSA